MRKEIKGMLTGLGVTFRTMTQPTVTVQYPHEREDPAPRARGRSNARRSRRAMSGGTVVAENVIFGLIAAAMVIGAFRVVTTDNVVHAALYLVVVLAGGAAQFLLLGQEFVAWVQVLVYIG